MDLDWTRKVLAAFEGEGVKYVVFGGIALNLHGLARATDALDVFIEPTRGNVERVRAALHRVWEDPDIDAIDTDELLGSYPALQYIPPEGGFFLDILTRLGEAWAFEDLEPHRLVLDGLEVSVVTPETLYRMKKDTVRARDWGDAARLKERFGLED